jgi:hypothetical protein
VLFGAPAFAEDLHFTLDNQSSSTIKELHISTLNSDSWEENILDGPIDAGGQAAVTLTNTNGICQVDMRIVYDDDSTTDERKINLCDIDGGTYTVSD